MAYVGMLKSRLSEEATSSCVDSGLEAQRTASAPPSRKAIIRLAVSLVTCKQAETRNPLSGCSLTKRLRIDSSTGICCPAHSILRLPASASPMFFTSPFFSSAVANVLLLNFDFDRERREAGHSVGASETRHAFLSASWKLATSSDFGNRGCPKPRARAKSSGAIRALPSKAGAAAAKVAISGGGLVNGAAQIERFNDGLGS